MEMMALVVPPGAPAVLRAGPALPVPLLLARSDVGQANDKRPQAAIQFGVRTIVSWAIVYCMRPQITASKQAQQENSFRPRAGCP